MSALIFQLFLGREPGPQLFCDPRQVAALSGVQVGSFSFRALVTAPRWPCPGPSLDLAQSAWMTRLFCSLPSQAGPDPRAFLEEPETFLARVTIPMAARRWQLFC